MTEIFFIIVISNRKVCKNNKGFARFGLQSLHHLPLIPSWTIQDLLNITPRCLIAKQRTAEKPYKGGLLSPAKPQVPNSVSSCTRLPPSPTARTGAEAPLPRGAVLVPLWAAAWEEHSEPPAAALEVLQVPALQTRN